MLKYIRKNEKDKADINTFFNINRWIIENTAIITVLKKKTKIEKTVTPRPTLET